MSQLRRYIPTKLCDGAQTAIFGRFLRPVFSASRVQHISDMHSKFALRPHHVWKYGRYPICDRWEWAREKKEKKEETIGRKYNGLLHWAAIIKVHNRIQLLKWSEIIISAYIITTRGPTRFITDSDSVVHQPNAINTRLHPLSVIVFNNQRLSIFCLSRIFMSRMFHPPATLCRCFRFSQFPSLHFGQICAVVFFPVVSCLAFSA